MNVRREGGVTVMSVGARAGEVSVVGSFELALVVVGFSLSN